MLVFAVIAHTAGISFRQVVSSGDCSKHIAHHLVCIIITGICVLGARMAAYSQLVYSFRIADLDAAD